MGGEEVENERNRSSIAKDRREMSKMGPPIKKRKNKKTPQGGRGSGLLSSEETHVSEGEKT